MLWQNKFFRYHSSGLIVTIALGWLAILLVGCASEPKANPIRTSRAKARAQATKYISEEELQDVLGEFVGRFALIIEAAADEIVAKSDDRQVCRQAVLWKMRSIGLIRDLLFKDDPRFTGMDMWAFCDQMHQYLKEGDGAKAFGAWQPIAIRASEEVQADIEVLVRLRLSPSAISQLQEEMAAWVKENPLRGSLARQSGLHWAVEHRAQGPWGTMLSMTTAINPLQGIDDAKDEYKTLIERIRLTAKHLPQQVRWETELMLYDLEGRQTISSAVNSFQTLADSFDRLATEAKQLPMRLRQETGLALDDLAAKSESLRLTIAEMDHAVSTTHGALDQADRVAQSVQRAAASLTETGRAWEATAEKLGKLVPQQNDGGAGGKSFDINEYHRAADSLTTAAVELRGLAADIHKLTQSDELVSVLDGTANRGEGLIDHVAWRILQLIVVSLLIALIYRFVSSRLVIKSNV